MKREFEKRTLKSELRIQDNNEKRTIVGFIPYNSKSVDMGFFEIITPTAFNKTLADGYDVKAIVNHNMSQILGRVKNNSLRLESREDGLYAECDLPNTSYANDVYNLIKDGYCNTMSFGFECIKDEWKYVEGEEIRFLQEVKLEEISFAVALPCYEGTDSVARSIRGLNLTDLGNTLSKEELKEEDFKQIREYIDKLSDLLPKDEKPVEETETNSADKITESEQEEQQLLRSLMDELKDLK